MVGGFRLGEADKVLTLVTEGHGIVRAVAKGVRRTKSRFGGRLEPLSHVAVLVYKGRSLDVISQVDTIAPYAGLRSAPDRLGAAFAMAEAAAKVAQEQEPAPRLYRLLTAALAGLDGLAEGGLVPPMYLTVFFLRLMALSGLAFAVDACAACGAPGVMSKVGVAEGGAVCEGCAGPGTYRVRPDTLVLLGALSQGRVVETALSAGRPSQGPEAAALVRRFVEYHLEVRLRASAIAAEL